MRSNLFRILSVPVLLCPTVVFAQEVPEDESVISIVEDTVWIKDSELSFDKPVIVSGATLTIEEGVHITLSDSFGGYGLFQIQGGRVLANGTETNPIVFAPKDETAHYQVFFQGSVENDPSLFRHVHFLDGGKESEEAGGDFGTTPGLPTLHFFEGRLRIENSLFQGSLSSDIRAEYPYRWGEGADTLSIINSNFSYYIPYKRSDNNIPIGNTEDFYRQANEAVSIGDGSCPEGAVCEPIVSLRNNYYGDITGPRGDVSNDYGHFGEGKKVSGTVAYSGFRQNDLLADPLIIVPGILGSEKNDNGEWVLDPILHIYDDLVASLKKNGYEEGKNLFLFPYDWKRDNRDTANDLKQKITDIKNETGSEKVDIAAHSMGGLVAREYIEGDAYQSDVDQLVTLGTPHRGAPKAYLMWEGGEFGTDLLDSVLKHHFTIEAEHSGYSSLYEYIRGAVFSVKQLLPDYDYLFDLGSETMRSYPENYSRNEFLENLTMNVNALNGVRSLSVIGKQSIQKSIEKIKLIHTSKLGKWENGMPLDFYSDNPENGFSFSSGDGTIPLSSAEALPSDKEEILDAEHTELPSRARCLVFHELSGRSECKEIIEVNVPNIFLIKVFSPIDIQVVSPSGKRIGKNFKTGDIINEIEGAFYTGYQTKNEFITIPNPEDGEYKILTQGTGEGNYRIEATKITEDPDMGEAKESTATLRGTATLLAEEEQAIAIEGDTVTGGGETDTIPPVTTLSLSGTEGANGWYTSDVSIALSAADNENGTGIQKTEYSFDSGTTWRIYTDPFVLSQEGIATIQYFSTDQMGNKEEVKIQTIKIDKTAPEAKISFNPEVQKLDIVGMDAFSQSVSVVMMDSVIPSEVEGPQFRDSSTRRLARNDKEKQKEIKTVTLTDAAGHRTELSFEKERDRFGRISIEFKSIAYDGVSANLPKTTLDYKWILRLRQDTNEYALFASHIRTDTVKLESHYLPKKHQTVIMEKPRDLSDEGDDNTDRRPVRKKISGMIIPGLTTEKGNVKVYY